jgi:predicted naringenin-chalcone synthase
MSSSQGSGKGATQLLTRPSTAPRHLVRRSGPHIAGIAVSDSDSTLSQEEVLERLGLKGDEFAERIFARAGVRQRHLDLSEEVVSRTLQGRSQQIERDLLGHSIRAIDALELDPERIGTVISASLYSLGGPTLAHRLVDHYAMSPATDKYHVTGVGCASAVPLMRLAAQTMREDPSKQALVIAAESMSGILSVAGPDEPRAKIIGSAIFGDGCAAVLLSNDPRSEGPTILASQVHQVASTLGAVSMDMSGDDMYLHLSRELPMIAGEGLGQVVDDFLAANRFERSDIQHWIVHPGGKRIIENVQMALELSDEDVATSWESLADHGNVGTPSILYVLKDTVEQRAPEPGDLGLMVTVGPGVTIGLMLLGW